MKKILSVLLALAMLLCALPAMADTTYTGTADSQIGGKDAVTVSVTLADDGSIKEVVVTECKDTKGVCELPCEQLPKQMVALNTINVDTVAGATMTSNAIMAAVKAALENGGVDVTALMEKKEVVVEKAADETLACDVVVIGAGGAGLAAAISAEQNGAKVIVVEKMPKVGGNTILAGGAVNAVNDRSEFAIKQNDSVFWHYTQTLKGGDYQGDPELVMTLVSNAYDAIEWTKSLGMEWQGEDKVFTVSGGLWPRAWKPVMVAGTGFFDTYTKYIDKTDKIDLMLNTKAEKILVNDLGAACGIVCTGETGNTVTINAKSVVVATGGFAKNVELRMAYDAIWGTLDASVLSTNHEGATGDGVKMLQQLQADFIQMGNIQLLPLGDPKTGSLSGNIEHGVDSRIFVNKSGLRYGDEGGRRDDMTRDLFAQEDALMWIVMDSDTYPTGDELNNFGETANQLVAAGRAVKADTLDELAALMGVDAENLKATIAEYNRYCVGGDLEGQADQFGRTLFGQPIDNGPFYAGARVPTVHHTMGGVRIDTLCRVYNENGEIIKNLYAAGEVTGGIHGTNRLGGNALTDTVVFGRIAGESAAIGK
ncbi:MAG: flavocytochrome c [Clostridiales bacterium]|nr:flavocytochrome c [Clostridiales bacterium]